MNYTGSYLIYFKVCVQCTLWSLLVILTPNWDTWWRKNAHRRPACSHKRSHPECLLPKSSLFWPQAASPEHQILPMKATSAHAGHSFAITALGPDWSHYFLLPVAWIALRFIVIAIQTRGSRTRLNHSLHFCLRLVRGGTTKNTHPAKLTPDDNHWL